jgi:hypothetical protein
MEEGLEGKQGQGINNGGLSLRESMILVERFYHGSNLGDSTGIAGRAPTTGNGSPWLRGGLNHVTDSCQGSPLFV